MIVNSPQLILQNNYLKPISEGEPVITPKSTGGDVQPPPNIQSQEAATYVRDSSGLISSELNDGHKTQDGHTSISISV
jgi:hypothetical protein